MIAALRRRSARPRRHPRREPRHRRRIQLDRRARPRRADRTARRRRHRLPRPAQPPGGRLRRPSRHRRRARRRRHDRRRRPPDRRVAAGASSTRGLLHVLVRRHNFLVYPSTMIHRRRVRGGGRLRRRLPDRCRLRPLAARGAAFRFRHIAGRPGRPVPPPRRQLLATSSPRPRGRRGGAGARGRDRRGLAPWRWLPEAADAQAGRWCCWPTCSSSGTCRCPSWPRRLRDRGLAGRRRIVLTSFGYNDSGGGTIVPRTSSQELAAARLGRDRLPRRRRPFDGAPALRGAASGRRTACAWSACFNRPHGLFDLGQPATARSTTRRSRAPSPSCSTASAGRRPLPQPAQPGRRADRRDRRARHPLALHDAQLLARSARAPTSTPRRSTCATARATAAATAPLRRQPRRRRLPPRG